MHVVHVFTRESFFDSATGFDFVRYNRFRFRWNQAKIWPRILILFKLKIQKVTLKQTRQREGIRSLMPDQIRKLTENTEISTAKSLRTCTTTSQSLIATTMETEGTISQVFIMTTQIWKEDLATVTGKQLPDSFNII